MIPIWDAFCSSIYGITKVVFVVVLVTNAIDLLPENVTFTAFEVESPLPLTGTLTMNNLLDNAERVFDREIKGPESFAVVNGVLYTTIHGGYVARVTPKRVIPVKKFGKPCKHWWDEEICGRPLGIAATPKGYLVVADSYYGIFKFNPKTGSSMTLAKKDVPIDGVVPKIFNDVVAAKDGSVYWSHSSSDFDLCDGIYAMLADPSGRLIKYSPKKKSNEVLLDKLYFANGITLSPEEDFILVCETGMGRVVRYYLKGPKKSQKDIFVTRLPGLPDGIRPTGRGGYFVSLNVAREADSYILSDILANYPFIRRTIARFFRISDWSTNKLYSYLPYDYLRRLNYIIGHFELITPFFHNRTTVVELAGNGEISGSLHGIDGSVKGISDVIGYNGYLYIGSPYNEFLARMKLSKFGGKFIDTFENGTSYGL